MLEKGYQIKIQKRVREIVAKVHNFKMIRKNLKKVISQNKLTQFKNL